MTATITATPTHHLDVGHHWEIEVEILSPEQITVTAQGMMFTDDEMIDQCWAYDPEYLWDVRMDPELILAHLRECNATNTTLPEFVTDDL
ncbi:hypothetical protein D9R06_09870 [Kocuria marina subsp. indica]|uniref:hypothetical protein n=1 Tax=Kocuria marina TaxID=223184 RepID=UPI000EF2854C|nr:hypothetical protein [Kocuria indica]RLP57278.1 hypothetical protein D9R06_09870 [Kocuria indica]